jgi:hypothetical protein
MKRLRVDLHSHTTRSDGNTPPRELVRLAREAGLDVLAVTDHDTVEAVEDCLGAGKEFGVRVVPGIELSAHFEGRDVHVLGFGIDVRSPSLRASLEELHRLRRERVGRICGKLAGLGVALEPSEVLAEAGGKSVGRRHVARAMLKKGLVRSIDDAFDRFLAEKSPANVPAHELTPAGAAELVAGNGGVASLAHPGFLDDDPLVERILDSAPRIRAVEVYHRYDSPRKHLRYLEVARRRGLIATGGSDFHGDEHPHNAGLGSFLTPPRDWKDLEMRLSGL